MPDFSRLALLVSDAPLAQEAADEALDPASERANTCALIHSRALANVRLFLTTLRDRADVHRILWVCVRCAEGRACGRQDVRCSC